jgi:hypothetical protein
MAPARLILWDVDHTLITTGGVGDDIYREAFREVTGIVPGELAEMTGRTEAVIFRDTLALHDLAPDRELFSASSTGRPTATGGAPATCAATGVRCREYLPPWRGCRTYPMSSRPG